ncbi:hypothetical protein ACIBI4_01225 [Streptomyces sp. NPDC050418]|uniref:hypothetical protein n=1 Tax=Streptomyces sp. NPDC050418 TaxID=3365612 RepID=UPI00378FF35D
MSETAITARAGVVGGAKVERLVCHPRLPLVAGLDAERPAVHVWDCSAGRLDLLITIGAESDPYGDVDSWDRDTPSVAWHPAVPALAMAYDGRVLHWKQPAAGDSPGAALGEDVREMEYVPLADYQHVAFSPDGHALWGWPSPNGTPGLWDRSDTIDLRSGEVHTGRGWDTGIVEHPAGGLVATYNSDQGATLMLFGRTDSEPGPLRFLRTALIIDVDGYEAPVFSADGRHFAIRGNAYAETLEVYEFPTLRLILSTNLEADENGDPVEDPDWSRQNIAFDARSGVLWVGHADGTLIELDLDEESTTPHRLLTGAPITALGRLATGQLVAATGAGDVALLTASGDDSRSPDLKAMGEAVRAFVDSTSEVPDGEQDLESHLELSDGQQSWSQVDLDTVTEASGSDPTWLQIHAAMNRVRAQDG